MQKLDDLRKFVEAGIENPDETPDRVEIDGREGKYQVKTYMGPERGV